MQNGPRSRRLDDRVRRQSYTTPPAKIVLLPAPFPDRDQKPHYHFYVIGRRIAFQEVAEMLLASLRYNGSADKHSRGYAITRIRAVLVESMNGGSTNNLWSGARIQSLGVASLVVYSGPHLQTRNAVVDLRRNSFPFCGSQRSKNTERAKNGLTHRLVVFCRRIDRQTAPKGCPPFFLRSVVWRVLRISRKPLQKIEG